MTDETDELLKAELLRLDILLRRTQSRWETPRNLAIIAGVIVALVGAVAGFTGYKIGSAPPPEIIVHLVKP